MTEPFPHHDSIVEKFWAENQELKANLFRSWYVQSDCNSVGIAAVKKFVSKGAIDAFHAATRITSDALPVRMPLVVLKQESEHLTPDEQFELARFIAPNVGYWLAPEPMNPDSPHADKDDLLIWAVKDALEDCRNSGGGNEIVDARIIERIEDSLSQAVRAYEALK